MNNNQSKGIFLDVDSSIVEKNLKITNNSQEEEFNKMLGISQDAYPSKLVKPFPGLCIKTKEISTESKFFVNICQTDAIPPPKDISESELEAILSSDEAPNFKVPMSIGEIRNEFDNKGQQVKVCDIAIHPLFFKKIENGLLFKSFFFTIIFEGLTNKHGIVCDDEKIILKNKKAIGTLQMHRIQLREVAEKMGMAPLQNNQISTKPSIEVLNSSEVQNRMPEYRLFIRKNTPELLIGEFLFPDLNSAKSITVDVGEDRIVIEAPSRHYFLDIFIPHFIRQKKCKSTFDKASKILTLTMPLIGG